MIEFHDDTITPADVAETQIGITEATGHNDGIPADRYMRGDALAWCAGFVLWCYDESDWPSLYSSAREYYSLRSVQKLEDAMRARGVWFGPRLVDSVEPGDLVFYANRGRSDAGRGRHVGLVVEGTGGIPGTAFETIEGNWGNEVKRRRVSVIDLSITGFARPRLS